MKERPLAIDLFCGLFGWAEGLTAEGWRVVGFDLEDMCAQFGVSRPPHVRLVIQDVLTLHGSQFRNVDLIVASPPCQEYSYMAMPWSLAKAKAKAIRADTSGKMLADLNRLFEACFRIQKEASFAAGRHIPLVVENVRGAQPWVGCARWNFGSFYLWGDVPALMPITLRRQVMKDGIAHRSNGAINFHGHTKNDGSGWRENGTLISCNRMVPDRVPSRADKDDDAGLKCGGDWFGPGVKSAMREHSSKSPARKMASAMIAKIPLPLARHIAATYRR